jgi:hypothetical protein
VAAITTTVLCFKMENLAKYANFIKRIFSTTNPNIRKSLIRSSNDLIIKAICEILLNIYHRTIPTESLSPQALKLFKKSKKAILKAINKKTPRQVCRQILVDHSESLVGIREIFK